MKRMILTLLCVTVGMAAGAQMHRYKTDFTLSAKNFVDTIPIEFDDNQLYVRVRVGGVERRFAIDTGSSQGILYRGGSVDYGRVLGNVVSHDANARRDTIKAVTFPTFIIGRLTIRGYTGSLLRKPVRQHCDGVIGFDLFNKGLQAKIDVRNLHMILTDRPRFFDNEDGFPMTYRLLRFVPNIKLSPYAGCMDEARFDTGSRRLYEMSRRSLQVFENRFPDMASQVEGRAHGSRAIGSFGAEHAADVAFLWLDQVTMGGFSFCDLHTMTTQGNSRVGAELLRYGTVTIRPQRREIVFQPYNGGDMVMVSNKQMDIAFVPRDGRATVGLIFEGSEHFRNGFRQGDVILSIDGHAVNTFRDFLAYPFIEGRQHHFLVRSALGNIREIKSIR